MCITFVNGRLHSTGFRKLAYLSCVDIIYCFIFTITYCYCLVKYNYIFYVYLHLEIVLLCNIGRNKKLAHAMICMS